MADADEIIKSGKADFVAMSRALIADPELISLEGKEKEVVPCIKCMRCHDSAVFGHFFQCSVNPTIGIMHHLNTMLQPVTSQKRVAVVGGGPAGMYAALIANKRGHKVTLYDNTDSLGGTLKFAAKVDFKYSLAKFRDYLIYHVKESTIQVILNTQVTEKELKEEGYDAVIIAVGATPLIPNIPGVEQTINAIDSYGQESLMGDRMIIIGGGQVGCETALHLARHGKKVTILDLRDSMAPDASRSHPGDILAQMHSEKNITQITSAMCIEIKMSGAAYKKDNEIFELSASNVILAAGMKPRTKDADRFIGSAPIYFEIGDCVKARTVEMAIREGYFAGINL